MKSLDIHLGGIVYGPTADSHPPLRWKGLVLFGPKRSDRSSPSSDNFTYSSGMFVSGLRRA